MTRDDIIRLAREACSPDAPFRQYVGGVDCGMLMRDEHLERFAALVAKDGRDKVEAEWRYLMVDARKASEQALEALENVRKHDIEDLYGLDEVISGFRASLNMGPFKRGDW
jgi:N-methylhydantoinase B/oxoprolinase/acetone carboxylase alpha subunit